MRTLQGRQRVLLTIAAAIWLILAVMTFTTGDYQSMPAWRIVMQVALGLGAIALLWEMWKPRRPGR